MNKIIITAAFLIGTASFAHAQSEHRSTGDAQDKKITAQDTILNRSRMDNQSTDDPYSMKTRPGVGMQMNNGTRREEREFKNTTDTPGHSKALPRR